MTPKEKAIYLVNEFTSKIKIDPPIFGLTTSEAKECALIAAEELRLTVKMCIPYLNVETYESYWNEVKIEIESL